MKPTFIVISVIRGVALYKDIFALWIADSRNGYLIQQELQNTQLFFFIVMCLTNIHVYIQQNRCCWYSDGMAWKVSRWIEYNKIPLNFKKVELVWWSVD